MNGRIFVRQPESQSLKRGEDIDFPIELDRENDDDSVVLKLEDLPRGLRADEVHFHRGESKATCHLHADRDASLVAMHEARVIASAPGIDEAQPMRLSVTDENGETGAQERAKLAESGAPQGTQPREGGNIGGAQTKETEGRQAGYQDQSGTGGESLEGASQPDSRTKADGKIRHSRTPAEMDDDDENRDQSKPGCCCQ